MENIYRKILIGFDKELLHRVNREARSQRLDRTKFIRKAIRAYIVSEEFRRASGVEDSD